MNSRLPIISIAVLLASLLALAIRAQPDQKAELVVQTGHSSAVDCVVFSRDGRLLASAGHDDVIKVWDATTGVELRSFKGHGTFLYSLTSDFRNSVAFSPDGKTLAAGSQDSTVKLWDIASGELRTLKGHSGWVNSVAFSPDGKTLASVGGSVMLWDVATGSVLRTIKTNSFLLRAVAFSPDGKTLAVGSKDYADAEQTAFGEGVARILDVATGSELHVLKSGWGDVSTVAFSADGKMIATGSIDTRIKLWDAATGSLLHSLGERPAAPAKPGQPVMMVVSFAFVNSIAFSPDGKTLVSGSFDNSIALWDVASGSRRGSLSGHSSSVNSVAFSRDGKTIASGSSDHTIRLWNVATNSELRLLREHSSPTSAEFSIDGKTIEDAGGKKTKLWDVSTGTMQAVDRPERVYSGEISPDGKMLARISDNSIKLIEAASGKEIRTIKPHSTNVYSIRFSPNGRILASGSNTGGPTELWDVSSGDQLATLAGDSTNIIVLAFSRDSKMLAGGRDRAIALWDVASGALLHSLNNAEGEGSNPFPPIVFSHDGKLIATGNDDGTIRVWNVATGNALYTLRGHAGYLQALDFSPDNKHLVSGSFDATLKVWSVASGKELCTLIALDEREWAVVTPGGLWDASPGARKLMHFVIGLEAISLDQMKDVYYVPGLLQKIFAGKSLPAIPLFSRKDLFPDVEFAEPKAGQTHLAVKVVNRGGGIGVVQVVVNGKEFVRDARPANFDPQTRKPVTLNISLKDAPLVNGGENKIEVIARNAAGSLTNRGTPRSAETFVTGSPAPKEDPNIYVIAGGISNYTADNLNLNFAAKDAEDFAKAVEIGAMKLLGGDKSKVKIRLLTSNGEASKIKFSVPDAKISSATKADFQRAFTDFKGATSNDIFIVYLAGHGISLNLNQNPNQPGGDTYLYLTQEATTTDKTILSTETYRKAMSISGEEIKDMMKQNKALKQVLILDTCAAGAASGSFVAKRDVPSDQISALERLKDNTGFYILMGSAADRVSYETSQYAQGLLTYSLLQGMKGAMLREDQYADVEMLFGYAKNTVNQLAKNIGGIQRPETITPDVSRSFDIGQFTATERSQITLATPIPLVLRPRLTNPKLRFDNLGLEKIFRAELRKASFVSARGDTAKIVFVESDEMPDAVMPSGDYTVDGETLTINLVLVKNSQPYGKEIVVSGKVADKEALIRQLIEHITATK
jgi:WD40 repeat protein